MNKRGNSINLADLNGATLEWENPDGTKSSVEFDNSDNNNSSVDNEDKSSKEGISVELPDYNYI